MDKKDIPGNALDTLLCLWLHGSTWDGNVPSKAGRDWLVSQKLAARGDGWQWLTEDGGRLCVEFAWGRDKEIWESKRRKERRDAEQNKARYTWAANELLACDYGDNAMHGTPEQSVGWVVWGWRDKQTAIKAHNDKRRIYGDSIDAAIDKEMERQATDRPAVVSMEFALGLPANGGGK